MAAPFRLTMGIVLTLLACEGQGSAVWAIQLDPTAAQVAAALEQGQSAAAARIPPDRLYAWFGSTDELKPKGFVMTKIVGLRVMSAHFALRGATPSDRDTQQILEERSVLMSVILFGATADFAVDSYMLLTQGNHIIKPTTVRFDARAGRTPVWPASPAYRAKIVASFAYADLNPTAKSTLSVFPSGGGELTFDLDFATID